MSSAFALPVGAEVGGLMIRRVLGKGGFGIVYEALDPDLDRAVALKEFFLSNYARREGTTVVPVDPTVTGLLEQGKARFLREARLLAMLHERAQVHTGSLVIVHRVLQANQTAYMVMKMYEGPTLRAHVQQWPDSVTQAWLLHVMSSVLDALDALHSLPGENLVHRDVSPDNIIVQPNGTPVLLDFGATRSTSSELTAMIFKPGFSPIEQYTEAYPQGPWTDLYALCGTAYYALSGKSPGDAVDRLAGRSSISAAQQGAGRFGRAFLEVLDRGLAVLPQDRFQNVAEMRQALQRAAAGPIDRGWAPQQYMQSAPTLGAVVVDDNATVIRPPPVAPAPINRRAEDPDATRAQPVKRRLGAVAVPQARPEPQLSAAPDPLIPAVPQAPASPGPVATAAPVMARSDHRPAQPAAGANGAGTARTRPLLWVAAGALVAVATGLAAYVGWPTHEPSRPQDHTPPAPAEPTRPKPVAGLDCTRDRPSWDCIVAGLARLAPPSQGQTFSVSPRSVAVGERLDLRFSSPRDGFLYVFSVDEPATSTVTLLFPRVDDGDNRVRANVPVKLPRRPAWDIVVNPPLGRSWLVSVLTAQPVPAWTPTAFRPVTLNDAMAGFEAQAPWRAFGVAPCAAGAPCPETQVVLPAEFQVR